MWRVLREMAVPDYLIRMIHALYSNNESYVRVDGDLSRNFKVGKGVRQGCILSPMLFNIYAEWIIRMATENWRGGVTIGGERISNLRYADDTILLASTEEKLSELLGRVQACSEESGLRLNRGKCCIMVVDREKRLPPECTQILDIERKNEAIYLGTRISNDGDCEEEIKRRIGMAKSAMANLNRIWKDHHISKMTKLRLINLLIFPIATYGSETWTIKASGRRRIEAFEMSCYRSMLRILWTAHRTNASILRELNVQTNNRLLPMIQKRILTFFEHVIRRGSMKKLCIQGKVDGKKTRGRSPFRFIDQVKELTNLSMAEIMRTAEDRQE